MSKTIFNESSYMYGDSIDFNVHFLVVQESYVNSLLTSRGYVYLNQIYEILGIKWDPKHKNECFIYENGKSICFNYTYTTNGFELKFELV